ncbi:DUF6609 family protein [Dethiobacter alkaliphilus]
MRVATPFLVFGILDGVVKIIFGLYMFYRWEAHLASNISFAGQL